MYDDFLFLFPFTMKQFSLLLSLFHFHFLIFALSCTDFLMKVSLDSTRIQIVIATALHDDIYCFFRNPLLLRLSVGIGDVCRKMEFQRCMCNHTIVQKDCSIIRDGVMVDHLLVLLRLSVGIGDVCWKMQFQRCMCNHTIVQKDCSIIRNSWWSTIFSDHSSVWLNWPSNYTFPTQIRKRPFALQRMCT